MAEGFNKGRRRIVVKANGRGWVRHRDDGAGAAP